MGRCKLDWAAYWVDDANGLIGIERDLLARPESDREWDLNRLRGHCRHPKGPFTVQ
jgi:hypothetical protein